MRLGTSVAVALGMVLAMVGTTTALADPTQPGAKPPAPAPTAENPAIAPPASPGPPSAAQAVAAPAVPPNPPEQAVAPASPPPVAQSQQPAPVQAATPAQPSSAPASPQVTAPATPAAPAAPAQQAAPATPVAPPAASPAPEVVPAQTTAPTPPKPQLGARVRALVDGAATTAASETETREAEALKAFYLARGDQPLWIADGSLNDRAVLVIAEIKKAGDWGLDASAFIVPDPSAGALTEERAAEAELALSRAALTYARHARGGRIENPAQQLSSYLDRMPQLVDPKTVLDQLAASTAPDATLKGFHPKHPQFEKLRQRYLALLKSTAAEPVVLLPKGPALSPGQKHPHVALLRQRLKVPLPAGTPETPADETLYDPALADAVKAFQTEAGLSPDGIVGPGSRAALNDIDVPSPERVAANMEMWRWIPDDLGATHIWVNLPEFTFQFVRDGKIVHEERIISGLVDKQTPIFTADMDMVTVHPRWNVPDSIKVRELYPSLARGGTYFEKQGLRMTKNGRPVDPYYVDWGSADIRQFDVHQPPGPANVLGLFKFTFHNKHIVYMHDTPTKHLFERPSRPFSHGCMRVRNPQRLAELVLEADKGWTPEQVAELVSGPPAENQIPLTSKIPVQVAYFTERITDTGEALVFKDVYGHEERVKLALAGRFEEIAVGDDHLAPVKYEKSRYAGGNNPLETFMNNLFGGF